MSRRARGVHDQPVSTQDQDNDITLASYETAVDRYLEHSSPPGPEMVRYLEGYADLVGSGRVLELGSGPGWDALHLEGRGVQVTPRDSIPGACGHVHRVQACSRGPRGCPFCGTVSTS